jgi:hypothetical protein
MNVKREAGWWRSIRWAAYGCLALALLQFLALPWPFGHPALGDLAVPRWIGQLSLSLLGALALFYRQLWAAVLLGIYGLTRLYFVAVSLIHILDGSAAASGMGRGAYLALAIPLPFAVLWIRGAWAALRLWRGSRGSREQAI